MTSQQQFESMIGQTAVDSNGDKIGKIGQLYLDDQTGAPQWVTISTGLFGTKESFAPTAGSRTEANTLVLAVTKDLVKDAPHIDDDGHLTEAEVDALFEHYHGYTNDAGYQTQAGNVTDEHVGGVGHDTSGPSTDDAMTRSEERLNVGTERVNAGRARLRKHIVTEHVTTTVPVSHEEVRLEREPITEANRGQAMSGGDLTEEEHEVILHAERPVVTKETVPVERVRLATETVTEEQTVSEEVRKEQIDQVTDSDAGKR